MITITRQCARRLRAVCRRNGLGIRHRGKISPLCLHAESAQLRAHYRYRDLAVECVEPIAPHPLDSIPTPLEALADVEGRDRPLPRPVESCGSRWNDRAFSLGG